MVAVDKESSLVSGIHAITNGTVRINGGYFAFKREIFDYIGDGEELVLEAFQRLIAEKQLLGYTYDGFWGGMDTFKDKQQLESLWSSGTAPWKIWQTSTNGKNGATSTAPEFGGMLENQQQGRPVYEVTRN
jgi:glucose-1-phosphate cytidylyltransferase